MKKNFTSYIIYFFRLILAAAFIFSAISKLINPGIVEIILLDQGIVHDRILAGYIVRLFIAVEFSIGLLYLFPYYLKKITIPSTWILLLIFTLYLIYSGFVLGEKENCGCFGELLEMSPLESILKNIILGIFSVILFKQVTERREKIWRQFTLWVLPLVFVFTFFSVKNPVSSQFNKYTYFEGKGRVDLTSGNKLVAVFSLDCEHCQETAKELAKIQKEKRDLPEIYVLFFSEGGNTVETFNSITHSNFPYTMIDVGEFFDLIGSSPPRVYILKDGLVIKFWDEKINEKLKREFEQ
jgi:thiol-disulfide isomerase/thioredoxin